MISNRFTTLISVSRSVWALGKATKSPVGTFWGHIQQATREDAQIIGQAYGLTHLIWCPANTNVRKGDALQIATGPYAGTYNVSAISNQTAVTSHNQHLELVAIQDNS